VLHQGRVDVHEKLCNEQYDYLKRTQQGEHSHETQFAQVVEQGGNQSQHSHLEHHKIPVHKTAVHQACGQHDYEQTMQGVARSVALEGSHSLTLETHRELLQLHEEGGFVLKDFADDVRLQGALYFDGDSGQHLYHEMLLHRNHQQDYDLQRDAYFCRHLRQGQCTCPHASLEQS